MSYRPEKSSHDFWRDVVRDNESLLTVLPREALANERAFRGYVTNGRYRDVKFAPSVFELSAPALEQLWTFIQHKAQFDMDAIGFDDFNSAIAQARRSRIQIRPATPTDRDFLRTLHHSAYRDVVIRQFGVWDEQDQDARFDASLADTPLCIVEDGGTAIGAIAVREHSDCLELIELQILRERQNQGLGSLLLRQQMQVARANGKPMRLRVLLENRARALYERNGFTTTGQTEIQYLMEWKP